VVHFLWFVSFVQAKEMNAPGREAPQATKETQHFSATKPYLNTFLPLF